ncbi:MAG: type II secretion system protein M [Coprobacillus sp.]|nr:type II secretion system protein M [Coprobacillus sp.]
MDKIKDSFKKLSSREKTLIYILVILLIVCFGWLILLQPQLTSHTSLKSSKDSLELQLTELKVTSSSSSTEDIKTQIMNVNQEIKALNDQFYNLMSKEDIDQLITNLTIEHKISPTNLTMSEITQTNLSDKSSNTSSDNSSDSTSDSKSTDDTKDDQASVYTCVVTQTCTGTKANLLNLIEDVKNMSGLHINSVAYENSTGNLNLTITYTVYMVEK